MRGGRFTVIIVGLTLAAGLGLPQLRDFRLMVWQSAFSNHQQETPLPAAAKIARHISRHPKNDYLYLAQAELESRRVGPKKPWQEKSPARLRDLVAEFPDSPAANLHLGLRLLAASGPGQRVEIWGSEKSYYAFPPRTSKQKENLTEAERFLRVAAQHDPANAAPQYLLVYALFQQGKDAEAEQSLREAIRKTHWSLYSREIRRTTFELFEAGGMAAVNIPLYVSLLQGQSLNEPPLRDLARLLAGLGEKRRQGGDTAGALLYYQAAANLGHVLLEGADTIADGLAAAGIISLTSNNFIDPKEARRVKSAQLSREEKISRLREIRREHFRAYLISQGKGELANQYERDYQRAEKLKIKSQQISLNLMTGIIQAFSTRYMTATSLSLIYSIYALGLFLLAALVALFTGVFKTVETPYWRWAEWLGMIILIFALGGAGIWLYPPAMEAATQSGIILNEILEVAVFLVLFVFPLLAGLRKTRGETFCSFKARLAGVLAGYRVLMPPTFAVLLAAALVFLLLAQPSLRHWAAKEKQRVLLGEVQSWQLLLKE